MKKIVFLTIFIASIPFLAFAGGEVVINEIAWMGQKDSYSREWIELYNTTDSDINLSGWKLKISKTEVPLKGMIPKNSFYLLEHNNDKTILEEKADLVYKKALNNKGELLALTDKNNDEIDKVDCSDGWFAGDNKTKQTMERIDSLKNGNDKKNWQNSQNENGTPKMKNSEKEIKDAVTKKETKELISDSAKENNLPIPTETYFVAGMVAVFSAACVLAVKRLA
ncbi:MAG: lamin tail domain-containing protein [Candidatus Paceibacterota bacterium]